MSPEQFESMKRYVGFSHESSDALRQFYETAAPHIGAIVDDFYAAIQAHPDAASAISGGAPQVARLKQSLTRWIEDVLRGPHDVAFLEAHSRIGRVHVRIDLPQEFMFTAMNRIRFWLLDVGRRNLVEPSQVERVTAAVNQILDLELAIMLDTYREDLLDKMLIRERELSEERHHSVIESIPAFVVALDRADRILIWNRRLEEATGSPKEAMLGKPGRHLVGTGNTDVRLPVAGGKHRLVRWELAEVAASHEGSPVVFALGIDVTEERAAQRRALRAERLAAVGTLAAGLAHEVRNPLNSALLQLQVLERRIRRDEVDAETLMPVLELVQDEVHRLEHLVNDFLAFARPTPLSLGATDVNALVERVASLVLPECNVRQIRLETDLGAQPGTIQADHERLLQVLLNIVRNGMEAVGEGGTVRVRTVSANPAGNVCVEIEDDGPGFPEDAPIFDAFFTTKEQGTGLGLSIAHSIVRDHTGTIAVESQPGRTVFRVFLPETLDSEGTKPAQRLRPQKR